MRQRLRVHQQGDRAAGVGRVADVTTVVGVQRLRLLSAEHGADVRRDVEERRLRVDERSPDGPDPEHDRLDAAALEAVRGEWLDGLLEGDDHVRQVRGGQREILVPGDLGPADVRAEAAGDGEPADAPGAGGVQRVEQAGRVRAEVADRVPAGDAASKVDDVADVVATTKGEEGVPVGDVEGFHGDLAGEKRWDVGLAVGGDHDLVSEVDERAGGVGADHAQPSGDEDHRITS